jgi:SAM-dependent methyltransferase
MRDYVDANRALWDELTGVHMGSSYYDVPGVLAGGTSLRPVELGELGDVERQRLLHLQCHFGLDTLSWARRGAIVTGVDFSSASIQAARELASKTGLEAEFINANVYELPARLDGRFDIVYTSYGVVAWLPELAPWADAIVRCLRPAGFFYIVEFHPIGRVLLGDASGWDVGEGYFSLAEPVAVRAEGSYADRSAVFEHKTSYEWQHPLSDIVNALIAAGLRIDFLHEFPFSIEQQSPTMVQGDDGLWRFPGPNQPPLLFSLKATKAA